MRVVYKYVMPYPGQTTSVEVPADAEFMHFAVQDGVFILWLCVDPDSQVVAQEFTVVGTGHGIANDWEPVGATIREPYVWHLFARTP